MTHVAIIGNGVSGITAARYIRKLNSNFKITVISAETEHFFSRTALMYVYMGHMRYDDIKPYEDFFWSKNRIDLVHKYVEKVRFQDKKLQFSDGDQLAYDKLILATGSTFNKFGWPGQDFDGVGGMYSWQDLEYMEKYTRGIERAAIVGGGLIGIEMAEMLRSRNIPVSFLVREKKYWSNVLPGEEAEMISNHIREHHVDLHLDTELEEILPDDKGRVKAVKTKDGREIPCQFLGLTAGVRPNIEFLKGTELETGKGIKVNHYLETNIDDVYAIGDCAEFKDTIGQRPPIEQVWYTGKMMGETIAHTICGKRTKYNPGTWFNSAKFMDIEYQTYGWVWPDPKDNERHFVWQDKANKRLFRFVFDKNENHALAFNAFGIRLRHEVCDKWINEKTTADTVMANLNAANFDPEFYKNWVPQAIEKYNADFGKAVKPISKKGIVKNFLEKIVS